MSLHAKATEMGIEADLFSLVMVSNRIGHIFNFRFGTTKYTEMEGKNGIDRQSIHVERNIQKKDDTMIAFRLIAYSA